MSSPSPVKCSTNFSIARLVGETPSSTPATLFRPEVQQHHAPHMVHPWMMAAGTPHPALSASPYSPVFAHPRLTWPPHHHLPGLLPVMHFGSLFHQHHAPHLMGMAGFGSPPAAAGGTLSPPHKLF